jgi:hypothetical protein
MKRRREPWYRNPFRLGGVGLLALLTGYLLLAHGEAEREASAPVLTGRLLFLAGAVAVFVAGVIWFLDARAPEHVEDEEHDEDEEHE